MTTPKLRDVVHHMMIRLRAMGPCSVGGLCNEVYVQSTGEDNGRELAWEWTARGLAYLFTHSMIEQYDDIFDAYEPTDDWSEGDLDAMLDELTFAGDDE